MFSKRLFVPSTVMLAAALFALTLPGCQKDQLTPQENTDEDFSLTFRGGSACDNGVKLLQMAYQSNDVNTGENKFVELLNNGSREEFQDLNNTSSNNLLEFTAINGTITWGSNFIGITSGGPTSVPNWINGTEALRIKLGNSANLAGWKMMAAGIWVTLQPGATVNVQMRKNGANVQPPVKRSNTGTANLRVHVPLSLFYLFDEIEVTSLAGNVQLQNSASGGTTWNRFVITDNSNDFIAARFRAGTYFWNSLIHNDHSGIKKFNHQYLSGGDFVPTSPDGWEWMLDGANPAFINRATTNGAFGPANPVSPGKDYAVNNGESMTFTIGPDVGTGASFTNVVVPIFRPSTNAATPRVILRKGGMQIASFNLAQQTGTLQYHLIGVSGSDFDEITFTTNAPGGPAANYYEIRTDYWSVLRFSLCQGGGGGGLLKNAPEEAEEAPFVPED